MAGGWMEQRAERGVNEQVGALGEDEGLKADAGVRRGRRREGRW
jgi:hypothetical protein